MKASSHNVYLIGAGLSEKHLTMDAVKALRKCDIILFDRLVDQKIITDLKCRKIYVGKKPGESLKQGRINKLQIGRAHV